MANGYWHGNNAAGWGLATGAAGYGLGSAGYGRWVGAWGTGSPMYAWGYSGYSNPYYYSGDGSGGNTQQSQASAYDYSQPISTTATPPEPSVTDQATSDFDQARDAFKTGDYAQALKLDNQALSQMPNDATLHEFLGLVLFAQGQYDQAAAPLYAVLSVGPGWDWTTLSGMYPDVATYTKQVRALETYIRSNPRSANARFVLSYHYITQGHDKDAVNELEQVVKLQPNDTLSAQLIAQFQAPSTTAPPAEATEPAAPIKDGMLSGNWTATPAKDAKIKLAIKDDGDFTWTASTSGKPATTISGDSALSDGVLTLSGKDNQQGALAGQVAWQDDDHFTFRLVGGPSGDPGLKFAR
ncbi:MAG: tetratricopeptide repeat protein [Isosphaeraceae bacterium]